MNNREIEQLNAFAPLARYKKTWAFTKFIHCKEDIIGLFTGNQAMKTSAVAYSYVLRILSWHPVSIKNVVYWKCMNDHSGEDSPGLQYVEREDIGKTILCFNGVTKPKDMVCPVCGGEVVMHERGCRILRFASESLPGQTGQVDIDDGDKSFEVKNTQYPEFMKWLPEGLLIKDITYRNMTQTIRDIYGGPPIIIEYVGYMQPAPGRGVQRVSVWLDEQGPYQFWAEQLPRILAEEGDIVTTLTAVDDVSYLFDEVFEKAAVYYRTQAVCDFTGQEQIEYTDSPQSIAVIQAATDDNPTLSKAFVEKLYAKFDDPDLVATRRYGLFRQLSGRIFKGMDFNVHVVKKEKCLPDGPFYSWTHARMIDFHESTPWAIVFASLSPSDELYVWFDYNPAPDKMVTSDIAYHIAVNSKDYKYRLNLIDPLAAKTQTNTGTTVVDDLNLYFREYKQEDICTGGVWETWDTKSLRGRDKLRERINNSKKVGVPNNNKILDNGRRVVLPTIWFLDTCKFTPQSVKQWRMGKTKPEQNHSHFPMCLEALLKDKRFRPTQYREVSAPRRKHHYFQGRR